MTIESHHPHDASHHDEGSSSIVTLKDKIGPLQSVLTRMAVSEHAGRGTRRLEAAQIDAEVKIRETALALETTKICTALTARAMPAIGGMATELSAATAAVDASLSSATTAANFGHIRNRGRNRDEIHQLVRDGQLTAEEGQILIEQCDHDMATDIGRSRERMHEAKTAVGHLHSRALAGIESARSAVKSL